MRTPPWRAADRPLALAVRSAGLEDVPLLARWNHALVRDEGHRNPMTPAQLCARMAGWLAREHLAWLFHLADEPVAYALVGEREDAIYLRQFYVVPERRRQGLGAEVIQEPAIRPPGPLDRSV